MYSANLANRAERNGDAGHVWEEKLTNATGTVEVVEYQTFRVRATGATTVTIDGILAMTMMSGEIAIFNAGGGDPNDGKQSVSITIAGAAAYVQVARYQDRTA